MTHTATKNIVLYYDIENGTYYTKAEMLEKFADLENWELTMRFYQVVKYHHNEN